MCSIVGLASVVLLGAAAVALPASSLSHNNPHYAKGRDVMVQLFEWKWSDIADECENFLGPMGYGGVQVSPIQENIIIKNRPWWERYQPISYRWSTRSGHEKDFTEMVKRCNKHRVRIYVDAILNHMTSDYDKPVGTGSSTAVTNARMYPGVPYGPDDFNTPCAIIDHNDPKQLRDCELLGLHDLNQANEHVRDAIVGFMNSAIDVGVAGFRIDAAKHMWPHDLREIYSRLRDLNVDHGFDKNSRPYVYQEVIDMGGKAISKTEYNDFAAVTEFRYGKEISRTMRGNNPLKWFKAFGESWDLLPSDDAIVFIDNHDNQRGHGAACSILTHRESKLYKMSIAFMLAHPYGSPRIMSSYAFETSDQGPPADENENIISPSFRKDGSCENGWICEHRWGQIYSMVNFRNVVNSTEITHWWDNENNQIAFSRGDRGFIAINADDHDIKVTVETKLRSGTYCDVISGRRENGGCTGKTVTVDDDGRAYVEILTGDEDGVLAVHAKSRI